MVATTNTATTNTDPRSRLSTSGAVRSAGTNVAPQYFEFTKTEPSETTAAGSRLWWLRSQAAVVCFAELAAHDPLTFADQPDEFMVMVTERGSTVSISASVSIGGTTGPGDDDAVHAAGRALVIVPPGRSSLLADRPTTVVLLFSSQSEALRGRCVNNSFFAQPDPNVAAWQAWRQPPDGWRLRVYDIDAVTPAEGRFGRLYRCTTGMVNWFYEDPGPRDPARLSPHHHDDFEQLSLQLAGDYIHHIRTPWTIDQSRWREDEHQFCTSPSVTVIPPPSIHTSQGVGDTPHQLLDLFCPPRHDFSAQPGWVLNADDYPTPTPSRTISTDEPESMT